MKIEKFKVLLYLKKSRLDKSGKAPIMGRITVNRSMVQFSCKISCTPDLWNPRESRLKGKSHEAVETNAKLDKLMLSIHTAFDTLVGRNADFDAEAVKNLFQGSLETQMPLLGMTDIVCEELRKRIGIDRAKGTYPAYIYTRRTLAEFIEKEFRTKDVAFGQMTEQFIHDYQSFILDEKGLAIDTCRHYLAIVKKVCRKAYKEGHADRCFFAHFSLPQPKEKTPKALSRESFEKIRDLVIPEHRASHILARDLFLFACYIGAAYCDLMELNKSHLVRDDKGSLWLKFNRQKTGVLCRIKLLPEAVRLIAKYRSDERETLLPYMKYKNYQVYLKALRLRAGISFPFTTHTARHTFGTMTLNAGIPIESIAKMMGHASISSTQIYAQVTYKKISEDMDRLIAKQSEMKRESTEKGACEPSDISIYKMEETA